MRWASFTMSRFNVASMSRDEWTCWCPWHEDRGRPNLRVNVNKGLYICMACGARGSFARLSEENLPAPDVNELRRRIKELGHPPESKPPYPEAWLLQFDFDHEYWHDVRRFSQRVIDRFNLGYDPVNDRLTIPIRDKRRKVLGVIQRRLDDERPKYMYPKGVQIGRHLWGAFTIRRGVSVALVEGSLDAVACWDARIPAVAMMGARLTPDQAVLLRSLGPSRVVIMTDNDKVGRMAVETIHEAAGGVPIAVGWYRPTWTGKDPGELRKQQRRLMFDTALPYHKWRLQTESMDRLTNADALTR